MSSKGILAAPLDNRDVRLWDVAGTRLVASKRTRRQVRNLCVSNMQTVLIVLIAGSPKDGELCSVE